MLLLWLVLVVHLTHDVLLVVCGVVVCQQTVQPEPGRMVVELLNGPDHTHYIPCGVSQPPLLWPERPFELLLDLRHLRCLCLCSRRRRRCGSCRPGNNWQLPVSASHHGCVPLSLPLVPLSGGSLGMLLLSMLSVNRCVQTTKHAFWPGAGRA
jgi:hypothetical protein